MKIKINGEDYKKDVVLKFKLAEPILVQVESDKDVYINYCPGSNRYIQLNSDGQHDIDIVSGETNVKIPVQIGEKAKLENLEGIIGRRKIKTDRYNDVIGQKLGTTESDFYPYIVAVQDVLQSEKITLKVGNFSPKKGDKFKWTINKRIYSDKVVEINTPDFLKADDLFTSLHVRLVVNDKIEFEGIQTFTLWNDYELNKLRGSIRPKIIAPEFISKQAKTSNYSLPITLYNQEKNISFNLTKQVVELLMEEEDSIFLPIENINIQVQANQQQVFNVNIEDERLKNKDIFGVAVHFKGVATNKMPVSTSVYAEFSDRLIASVITPTQNDVLNHIFSTLPISTLTNIYTLPHNQVAKSAKSYMDENFEYIPPKTLVELQSTIVNPLSYKLKNFKSLNSLLSNACTEEEEGEVKSNNQGDFVCQIVPDSYETVLVPPRILNAKKGDIILTPGGNSFIGNMMRVVSPPQFYSHCGIMVKNFTEVRHSTASEEWLQDNLNIDDNADSIPSAFYPPSLKYGWPGTITQTIENAYYGEIMSTNHLSKVSGPEFKEKEYTIKGFSENPSYPKGWGPVEPKVVKPDPFDEAEDSMNTPNVRSILKEVADKAKLIDGHYRFYCYSDADIFFKNEYKITQEARNLFWDNSRNPVKPTVCSSFIWSAIKSLNRYNIEIEGQLDASDLSGPYKHAEIDENTKDGLYLYTEDERKGAVQVMYDSIIETLMDQIRDRDWFWGPFVESFTPNRKKRLGNQICNAFAYDDASVEAGSSTEWRNPDLGRAVSPDDILNYWDKMRVGNPKYGLYGYNERLHFRPARYLNVPKYQWYKVKGKSRVKGKVIDYKGNPCPNLAVKYTTLDHVMTDRNGEFSMDLYYGEYNLECIKIEGDGSIIKGETRIEVRENETLDNVIVKLVLPPEKYREIQFTTEAKITNVESTKANIITHASRTEQPSIQLVPRSIGGNNEHAVAFNFKDNREIRVEYEIDMLLREDLSLKVSYKIKLYEGASSNTHDLDGQIFGEFIVPKDEEIIHEFNLKSNEDDFWVKLFKGDQRDAVYTTFKVKNLQSHINL